MSNYRETLHPWKVIQVSGLAKEKEIVVAHCRRECDAIGYIRSVKRVTGQQYAIRFIASLLLLVSAAQETCTTSSDGRQEICTYRQDVNGDGIPETCTRTIDRASRVTVSDICSVEVY